MINTNEEKLDQMEYTIIHDEKKSEFLKMSICDTIPEDKQDRYIIICHVNRDGKTQAQLNNPSYSEEDELLHNITSETDRLIEESDQASFHNMKLISFEKN